MSDEELIQAVKALPELKPKIQSLTRPEPRLYQIGGGPDRSAIILALAWLLSLVVAFLLGAALL